jgi:hypothetical protein
MKKYKMRFTKNHPNNPPVPFYAFPPGRRRKPLWAGGRIDSRGIASATTGPTSDFASPSHFQFFRLPTGAQAQAPMASGSWSLEPTARRGRRPHSDFRIPHASVLCHLSSDICSLSPVLCPLLYALCSLPFFPLPHSDFRIPYSSVLCLKIRNQIRN